MDGLGAASRLSAALADTLAAGACAEDCDCANGTTAIRRPHPATWCQQASVADYLRRVYPVARWLGNARPEDERSLALFRSLHFFYDQSGCAAPPFACRNPGGLLRWLYDGLLPCTAWPLYMRERQPELRTVRCLEKHFAFAPAWAQQLSLARWVEVEHRAFGLGIPGDALPGGGTAAPTEASDFLDAGVAGMWYLLRRGTGIFYELGRTAVAPGKNAMVALLLKELAADAPKLSDAWRDLAASRSLFRTRRRRWAGNASAAFVNGSGGPWVDAERLLSTANGSRTCDAAWVRWCRCRFLLSDHWDEPLVWLARALGYETLVFTATLLATGGCTHAAAADPSTFVDDEAPTFVSAYPELVDVRPLTVPWTPEQDPSLGLFHDAARQRVNLGVYTLRKRPGVAAAWVERMRRTGRLTLRDPLDPGDVATAQPCNFSVSSRLLQCRSHLSAQEQLRRSRRCGLVMCGQRGTRVHYG